MTNQSYDRNLDDVAGPELGGPQVPSNDLMPGQSYPNSAAGEEGTGSSTTSPEWSNDAASSGSDGQTGGTESAVQKAGGVAKSAAEDIGAVAESAAAKADVIKDVALERGGDVAEVAKDELARLAHDARTEVQTLWRNTSEQLSVQASAGQQQAADLLHSLAGELGDMASKSENGGPLTALAKQAAAKGGELSNWLAKSEPSDVLIAVRRFARRRPFAFLATAALAGVVVGRLGRGLMAAAESDSSGSTSVAGSAKGVAPATAGVTTPPPMPFVEVPSFGADEAPDQTGSYPSQPGLTDPYTHTGGVR